MKNRWWLAVTALLTLLLVAMSFAVACAEQPPTPPLPGTVTDDLGRPVNITEIPQRLISLAPSNTEILFALNLGDRVVGVTEYCNYPPEVERLEERGDLTTVGGFSTPDIEKIIALDPDLILAAKIHQKEVIPKLEKRGFTVFALVAPNLDKIVMDIEKVGKITGEEIKAAELAGQMRRKISEIADRVKDREKPRVFYVTWHDPLYTTGTDTIINDLLERAGGTNIFSDITGHKTVDLEAVIARNPQVIITGAGHGAAQEKPFIWAGEEPRLGVTEARKNSRVYRIDADIVSRSGPRAVDGLENLARFIHPDIFGE